MITTLKEVRDALNDERYVSKYSHIIDCISKLDAMIEQQEKAEPVAWRNNSTGALSATLRDERLWTPLYTAPQQGKAEPLTIEQRVDIAAECCELDFYDHYLGSVGKIIDLTEAAHGIGVKP